jgi:hypothetical protein
MAVALMAERTPEIVLDTSIVEVGGVRFSYGRLDINQMSMTVEDITPLASQTAIAVARAEYVEPVRLLVTGYVITVVSIAVLTVGLVIPACVWHWEWTSLRWATGSLARTAPPKSRLTAENVVSTFER